MSRSSGGRYEPDANADTPEAESSTRTQHRFQPERTIELIKRGASAHDDASYKPDEIDVSSSEARTPRAIASPPQPSDPATNPSSRRQKAHTMTACSNCKQAHLGCDDARPCGRCVVSGKQSTCRNVPQKKRGRPRLRAGSDTATRLRAVKSLNVSPQLPDIRTGSIGSLQSAPDSVAPSSPGQQRSASSLKDSFLGTLGAGTASRLVVPTAWLDLDFKIIEANKAFLSVFGTYEGLLGRTLSELAVPGTPDLFQILRTKLRDEREVKDPSYLPPIITPGEDALGSMESVDTEDATKGFDTLHGMLSFTFASGMTQTLSTKFSLARTSRYFIIMSLPVLASDFLEVIAGQAARVQEASAGPVRVSGAPFQHMTMFSDNRVAKVLSSGTSSSPASSPGEPSADPEAKGHADASDIVQSMQPPISQGVTTSYTPQALSPRTHDSLNTGLYSISNREAQSPHMKHLVPISTLTHPVSHLMEASNRDQWLLSQSHDDKSSLQSKSTSNKTGQVRAREEDEEIEDSRPEKKRRIDINSLLQ